MVLAGDPQQLGPSPRSPVYWSGNFLSILERLLGYPVYSNILPLVKLAMTTAVNPDINADNRCGVFLTKNYRSHKEILEVSSQLFYGGHLEECGTRAEVDALLNWRGVDSVPGSRPLLFPVLVLGTDGKHSHEPESPSFSNTREAERVCDVCYNLLNSEAGRRAAVTVQCIGVIAAFRSQVLLVRQLLRAKGMGAINVGEVEDFQGQEVRIAVVSTVLSSRVPSMEVKGALGLYGDHRRFNVAITRGKALVVVLGSPSVMLLDPYWKIFLEHCFKNGTSLFPYFPYNVRIIIVYIYHVNVLDRGVPGGRVPGTDVGVRDRDCGTVRLRLPRRRRPAGHCEPRGATGLRGH